MKIEKGTLWSQTSSKGVVFKAGQLLKQQGFKRGATESNLYLEIKYENMIIVVVYVDDIIFGSNLQILNVNFASEMKKEFKISLLGELPFFLGLQVYET